MGLFTHAFITTSLLAAASLGSSGPTPDSESSHSARANKEPCAQVNAAQQEQLDADQDAGVFFIKAKLAHDCLTSVPFKKKDALRVIDGLGAFWQWQSTIDYLKDPPKGYMMPATDIDARLADIRDKAAANKYDNEFAFQSELQNLAVSTHDAHFNMNLDALNIFTFRRDDIGPIVSVSEDGGKFPEVYAYYDLQKSGKEGDWKPSPITKIDGKDAVEWLKDLSYSGRSQDPDSLYNELFYTMAGDTQGLMGNFFTIDGEYTGPSHKFGFANGTTTEYENYAAFSSSFKDVEDGESFYSKFCNGELPVEPGSKKRDLSMPSAPSTPKKTVVKRDSGDGPRAFYPESVFELETGEVAGYFLNDDEDTAVLSMSAFTAGEGEFMQFSKGIAKFLATCKEKGKSKLIIDTTTNGGGTIFLGYDVFKQLFPDADVTTAFNIRATEQLELIGNKAHDILTDHADSSDARELRGTIFDIDGYLDLDDKPYESWADLFGPETTDHGNFTHLARWNFNDKETSEISGGLVVSGFLDRSDLPPQVFDAENMVLLTDGTCGSTCTIFANLLKMNGVKSIVTGGRPRDGPVQPTGGVRGTHVLTFEMIYYYASSLIEDYSSDKESRRLAGTDIGEIARDGPYVLARTYGDGLGARVNVRNSINPDDEERIPRQFAYEPADCRIWLTKNMVFDAQALWSTVANTVWGDGKCTPGSSDN